MNKNLKPLIAVAFVLIFLAIQMIVQTVVLVAELLLNGKLLAGDVQADATLSTTGLMISMTIFSIVSIALFTVLKWSPVSRSFYDRRPWGVLFWSILVSVGLILPSMYFQEVTMPDQWPDFIQQIIDQTEQTLSLVMSTTGGYAVVCLLAPIAEELVFRGAVLRTLLQWKPEHRWLMIMLSALLFALSHMNPAQFFHPLLIGLLLGWMYERTGSVLPGIIYHWVNNTVAYLLYHAYPSSDITIVDIFGSQGRVLMAIGFSLLIVLPSLYQLHLRMRKE